MENQALRAWQDLLQEAAHTSIDCARTSDHLFSFDELRFLLIAVECDRAKATALAQASSSRARIVCA